MRKENKTWPLLILNVRLHFVILQRIVVPLIGYLPNQLAKRFVIGSFHINQILQRFTKTVHAISFNSVK